MNTRTLSFLELVHPRGTACRSLVVGENCPATLRPAALAHASERVDLILLTPATFECRSHAWLQQVCATIRDRLAADGIVYLLAPPKSRRRLRKMLGRLGLTLQTSFMHLPDCARTRYLLPVNVFAARLVASMLPRRIRRIAMVVFSVLGIPGVPGLAETVVPCVAVVAQRAGAKPLFHWLFAVAGHCEGAIIRTSWRGDRRTVTAFGVSPGSETRSVVAKLNLEPDAQPITREAANLEGIATSAQDPGTRVPRVVAVHSLCGHPVLMEDFVPGECAAFVLADRPAVFRNAACGLARWLLQWNTESRFVHYLDDSDLERFWLRPASVVSAHLEAPDLYAHWLREHFDRLDKTVSLVAAHQDLTMWNIVVDAQWNLGVLDWEMASEHALPLMDFHYAICDAASAISRYSDGFEAFRACFVTGGRYTTIVNALEQRLVTALGISAALRELCVHACWLHHAANEAARERNGRGPFLRILQYIARQCGDCRTESH